MQVEHAADTEIPLPELVGRIRYVLGLVAGSESAVGAVR
jgi:hypothetical protein